MLKLILIRHAATYANEAGTLLGFSESDISPNGAKQIEALTKQLARYSIDAIYSSPSMRAIKTIQETAVQKGIEIHILEQLKEIHFGDFEGICFQEIQQRYPDEVKKMIELGDAYTYPKGENLIQSYNRLVQKIDDIKKRHDNQTILLCAHGGTIRNILSHLISKNHKLHWHFKIDHASLTIVTIEHDFSVLEKLNDTSFLQNMV